MDANIEKISEEIHNMWMQWAQHVLATEPLISEERTKRWKEECFKPYEELSETMKQRDRDFAIKILERLKDE